MTSQERERLDRDGYVVLEAGMGADLLQGLRTRILELFDEEGDRAGSEFKTEEHARRLANLVDKGDVFRRAIALPREAQPPVKLQICAVRDAPAARGFVDRVLSPAGRAELLSRGFG